MSWFFDRVPDDRLNELFSAWAEGNLDQVLEVYNEFKVVPTGALCGTCKRDDILILWTNHGMQTTWIEKWTAYERDRKRPPNEEESDPDSG